MNSYEQKQQARRERFEARAEKARQKSSALYEQGKSMASIIPFGQPILVGHHSEKRDRNYRAKIGNKFDQAHQESKKADHYESRAASVGLGGISSDDPDAILKLTEQLIELEQLQERMKETNKTIRKNKTREKQIKALVEMGHSEKNAEALVNPDYCGRIGFASYQLTNNNANINRIRDRIKTLEWRRQQSDKEISGNGYVYREDTEENRAMFIFDGKPDDDTRTLLKRWAFKWSPTRSAWVRQLTGNAKYAAKMVRETLDN